MNEVVTITKEEWNALKPGDVVLWRGYCLRTVVEGSEDDTRENKSISFSKLRNSWTGQATTHYNYTDAKTRVVAIGKRIRTVISKAERARLELLGFDVRKAMVKQIRAAKETKLRMGRALCNRKFVLP